MDQKISLWTRLFGRFFGKLFLKYLKSLDFDINKYPKNSKTLKEFKSFNSEESFLNQKKTGVNKLYLDEAMQVVAFYINLSNDIVRIIERNQPSFKDKFEMRTD